MISVVAPVYNESLVLREYFARMSSAAESWGEPLEVLLVDDGSSDGSWELIRKLHHQDSRWKGVRLGRNFGHQAAISAGLYYAGGDCVIVMDADLQDPPEETHRFIEKWREGYHVVFAVRQHRKESLFKRWSYKLFYRILARLAYVHIPLDAGDFCAMDRRVVNILKALPERNRFVRGMRSWVGFRQIGLPYDRPARSAGETKYTYLKLINLAIDGITAFTAAPLRAATLAGLGTSVLSLFLAFFYLLTRVFHGFFHDLGFPLVPGFATVIIALLFLSGIQLTFLGIVGEYIARIYDEVKARPIWTTMELLGIEESPAGPSRRETTDPFVASDQL